MDRPDEQTRKTKPGEGRAETVPATSDQTAVAERLAKMETMRQRAHEFWSGREHPQIP